MSLIQVQPGDYTLSSSISEDDSAFLCRDANNFDVFFVAKKYPNMTYLSIKKQAEASKTKVLSRQLVSIVLPDKYWEDKTSSSLYLIMPRLKMSLHQVILEHRRKGQYIPMKIMKKYVEEYVEGLRNMHKEQIYHNSIKPTNLFVHTNDDMEDEYLMADVPPFANKLDPDFVPPEQLIEKQNFYSSSSGLDRYSIDVWQLGMVFLILSTLKSARDLQPIKDKNVANDLFILELKENVRNHYSKSFLNLLEAMLARSPAQRKKVNELGGLVEMFLEQDDIDLEDQQFEADVDTIVQEFTARVRRDYDNVQSYLEKYDIKPMSCRISNASFFSAAQDIGLTLTNKEKQELVKHFDPDSIGEMNLSKVIREDSTRGLKMKDLPPKDEMTLRSLCKDMINFIEENKIDLQKEFHDLDLDRKHYLDVVVLNEKLTDIGLGLEDEDLKLVRTKYDPESKGVIYYEFFIQDIIASKEQTDKGVDDIICSIYKTIRERFTTFHGFFKKYDEGKQFLTYASFNMFLKNFQINPSNSVLLELFQKLDPDNRQEILFSNFRRVFELQQNIELKSLLTNIAFSLVENDNTFVTLMKNNCKGRMITQQQMYDALRTINVKEFKRPDLVFLLNVMNADKGDEIDYRQLNVGLQALAKKHQIKYQKGFEDEKGGRSYEDNEPKKRDVKFQQAKFRSQKELLDQINHELKLQAQRPEDAFKGANGLMDRIELKNRLRDMNITRQDQPEQYDELILNITAREDNQCVYTELLCEALNYFSKDTLADSRSRNQGEARSAFPQEESIFSKKKEAGDAGLSKAYLIARFCRLISRSMKIKNYDFDLFKEQDTYGENIIKASVFRRLLRTELGMDIEDDRRFDQFVKSIEDEASKNYVSLQLLKTGLDNDAKAEKVISELRDDIQNVREVFRKYDLNKNSTLEKNEFSRLVNSLYGSADSQVLETLFNKFDSNGDRKINTNEFRQVIDSELKSESGSQMTSSIIKKPASKIGQKVLAQCELLTEALDRERKGVDIFDKRQVGSVPQRQFTSICDEDLGIQQEEIKDLIGYLKNSSNQVDTLKLDQLIDDVAQAKDLLDKLNGIVKDDVESYFYEYDQNENDVLEMREFQKLVRQIHPKARQKPIDTLFAMVDTNQDNTISMREFKAKVKNPQYKVRATEQAKPTRFDRQQSSKDQSQVVDFIAKSQYLPQELEALDPDFTNLLDFAQVAQAFSKSYGPSVDQDGIQAVATQLNAIQVGRVNYKLLVKNARSQMQSMQQSSAGGTKLEKICRQLKEDLEFKNVSIIPLVQPYDPTNTGKVKVGILKSELTDKGIKLRPEDYELLFSVVQPDQRDQVPYEQFVKLIYSGPESIKHVRFEDDKPKQQEQLNDNRGQTLNRQQSNRVSRADVDKAYENVIESLHSYMERQHYSLVALFRKANKSGSGSLTYLEFQKMLQQMADVDYDEQIVERLFDRFDVNSDQKIHFKEFEDLLFDNKRMDIQQIMSVKYSLLNGRNPQNHQEMQFMFSEITRGPDFNFLQFSKFVRQYRPENDIIAMDQLFRYFDRQNLEKVTFDVFYYVMNENQVQQGIPPGGMKNTMPAAHHIPPQTPTSQYPLSQSQGFNRQQSYPTQQTYPPQQTYSSQQTYPPQQGYPPQQPQQPYPPQQTYPSQQAYPPQQTYPPTYPPQANSLSNPMLDPPIGNPMASQEVSQNFANVPQQFDRYYYEQAIKQNASQMGVDVFDIFCQYDQSPKPDFILSNIPDLQTIFSKLSIQAPPDHVNKFYYYYSHNSNFMSYAELYLRLEDPSKLIAKALHLTMLRHANYTLDSLFFIISNNAQAWTIQHFEIINQNLNLGLSQSELQDAFAQWDRTHQQRVTLQQYQAIMAQSAIKTQQMLQQTQNKPNAATTRDEILRQFLLDLSAVVHSRQCFNLYEDCDYAKTNLITLADFEKQTKTVMPDVQVSEMQAFRQVMSKDGFVNVSDLARALNVQQNTHKNFSVQQEKQQFGVNQTGQPQKQKQFNQQAIDDIIIRINDYLKRKQKNYDDLGKYLFGEEQSVLNKNQFCNKFFSGNIGLTEAQCMDLYDYLDVNQSGSISINEFKMVFAPTGKKNQTIKQVENVAMGKEIEEEIRELFQEIDVNKNQQLDMPELRRALLSIGISPSDEELDQYFRTIDKNKDGTIRYDEFSLIVKDLLKREMLQADELLDELRREFRLVCNPTTRMLSKEQMRQVFHNLGVHVKEDELDALFQEIDQDKSGTVDIDEFIYFIQKNQSGMSGKAAAAVMNIKGARRISLHDLRDIFETMPKNFINSFIRNLNKSLLSLPSSALKPKLDSSGFFYQDLNYVEASQFNINTSVLDRQNVLNNLCFEIRALEATGIPIPDETKVQKKEFLKREVGFILYDRKNREFFGNCAYISANWRQEYEDRWIFDGHQNDHTIYFRWGDHDDSQSFENSFDLIIELITYISKKNKLIQLSCSYAVFPLISLKPGKHYLEMKGGAPNKDVLIQQEDVRTNRTGWRAIVKSLSSAIKSQILLEVTKVTNNATLGNIKVLPNRCLLPKWGLQLWKGYREYYATRTVDKGDINLNLSSEVRFKAWMNIVDCPDTHQSVAQLWSESIEHKYANNHKKLLEAAQAIGDAFYLCFKNADFKFSSGNPTDRVYHDSMLMKKRAILVNDTITDIKQSLELLPSNQQNKDRKILNNFNMDPMNIEEMMDNDDEDEIKAIERFFEKKSKKMNMKVQ